MSTSAAPEQTAPLKHSKKDANKKKKKKEDKSKDSKNVYTQNGILVPPSKIKRIYEHVGGFPFESCGRHAKVAMAICAQQLILRLTSLSLERSKEREMAKPTKEGQEDIVLRLLDSDLLGAIEKNGRDVLLSESEMASEPYISSRVAKSDEKKAKELKRKRREKSLASSANEGTEDSGSEDDDDQDKPAAKKQKKNK
jgi:hypothetical protein